MSPDHPAHASPTEEPGHAAIRDVFVLDDFDGGLVVVPLHEAQRLAVLTDSIEAARTWGEFLESVADDPETQAYLADQYSSLLPSPSKPFDANDVPGFAEGIWPVWPKQAMLDWLPASIKNLGEVRDSMMTGPFLHLPESLEDEVIDALEAEGFEWRYDLDDLVVRACGSAGL